MGTFPGRSVAAVSGFLDRCERRGLKVEMGSTGCSVRLRPPEGSKPLSVAWIFPPAVTGWMSLTGIAIGCERSLLSPDSPFGPAFQPYLEVVSSLPGLGEELSGYVAAVEVRTDRTADQLPTLSERIVELTERVEECCKEPSTADASLEP